MGSNTYNTNVNSAAQLNRVREVIPNSIDMAYRIPVVLTEVSRSIQQTTLAETTEIINNTYFDLVNDVYVYAQVIPDLDTNNLFLAVEEVSYDGEIHENYYGITELDTDFTALDRAPGTIKFLVEINYDQSELDILEGKYSSEELVFLLEQDVNFSFERGEGDTFNSKQSMIEYDSISSLGSISQETITISTTTGSITGLITEQAQTITDIGGLSTAGRSREIANTNVRIAGTSGTTVTTSGY